TFGSSAPGLPERPQEWQVSLVLSSPQKGGIAGSPSDLDAAEEETRGRGLPTFAGSAGRPDAALAGSGRGGRCVTRMVHLQFRLRRSARPNGRWKTGTA